MGYIRILIFLVIFWLDLYNVFFFCVRFGYL